MHSYYLSRYFGCGYIFGKIASAIECYVCNATDSSSPFQCGEWFERFDTPDIKPQNCAGVHGAKYCVKHIGRFEGILFIFCSEAI